jgi:hypothetical protein
LAAPNQTEVSTKTLNDVSHGTGRADAARCFARRRANMLGPRGFRQHSIVITRDVGRLA